MTNEATQQQNRAAEPDMSTWLSANAGSGKTRVLTDRVARLLLEDVEPQNILCLTYTKAAASEMQNRLFKRLGDWAMRSDHDLGAELAKLGITDTRDPERLAKARRLFARAIETPGGLRIQTIHSFCASLLRRFPLEAGVTPNFVEMDDRTASVLREDVVDHLADGANPEAVDALARYFSGDELGKLTQGVAGKAKALLQPISDDDIAGWFGLPPGYSAEELIEEAFDGSEGDLITAILPAFRAGTVTDQKNADKLAGFDFKSPKLTDIDLLCGIFLFGASAKTPFGAKIGSVPTKKTQAVLGDWMDDLNDLMLRIEAVRDRLLNFRATQKTQALYTFARAFLPAYEAAKQRNGWLDFDDLIEKTRDLLANDSVAAWVLYRLDGGLDHILVDEAQDTSPTQWQVIESLAQEFTSGLGARDDVLRTIFVVGDKKQSIYSFQGADPREFDRMRDHFSDRLQLLGQGLRSMELEYSFRSSDAIMRFIDIAMTSTDTRHRAFYAELPGRVDLWPTIEKSEGSEKQNWYDPIDILTDDHHDVILAREVAKKIRDMVGSETIPASNGKRRLVKAGDILILVRRRSALFQEIIRACKAIGLPVAGADRLKLTEELAVKDLMAVLAFLATPEDSLSLASALRSPLFGWSEAQLYDLAAGRTEPYLWATLRNRADEFSAAMAVLNDLRDNADFLRPYDLIERILTRHDGRRKLLARLGPEAEDGIDALLSQSLAYERMDVPSLTGFLTWLEVDQVEVKRQMDNAGDQIRVMTVHGAKGLEAPIVILPDTAKHNPPIRDEIIPLETGEMVWKVASEHQPEVMKTALAELVAAQTAENERLFYVAVTRAEVWLIIVAAGEVGEYGDSWHQKAQKALTDLGAVDLITPVGMGLRLQHMDWQAGEVISADIETLEPVQIPGWAQARIMPADRPPATLAPSQLGGAKVIWQPGVPTDDEDAKRRGTMVHRLLDILPALPRSQWQDTAQRMFAVGDAMATPDEIQDALGDATRVMDAPDLQHIFTKDVLSEVDITASLPDLAGQRIAGAIDRLMIHPDRILAIDFKTNAVVPDRAEATPDGLLRQMGAYQAALETIYPDRRVETAILWTRVPALMVLPNDIVRAALRTTAIS